MAAAGLAAEGFHPPPLDRPGRFPSVVEALIAQEPVCPASQFHDRREGVIGTFGMARRGGDTAHPDRLQCGPSRLTRLLRAILAADRDVTLLHHATASAVTRADAAAVVSA